MIRPAIKALDEQRSTIHKTAKRQL